MTDPVARDVEKEAWQLFDALDGKDDAGPLQVKLLELVVKVRTHGEKVKPETQSPDRELVERARRVGR